MRSHDSLVLAMMLCAVLLCPGAAAFGQVFVPAFKWVDEDEPDRVLRVDPELRRAGRHLLDRMEALEWRVPRSYVMVTATVNTVLYVDRGEAAPATVIITVRVIEHEHEDTGEGTPPRGRGTLFRSQVFLGDLTEPLAASHVADALRRDPWHWYCLHYDGEHQHQWVSPERAMPDVTTNLSSVVGKGTASAPLRTASTPWQGSFPLFSSPLAERLGMEATAARALYAYAARGKVRRGIEPVVDAEDVGRRRAIRLTCDLADVSASGPTATGPAATEVRHEMRFVGDWHTGLPLLHEQEMTWDDVPRYLYSRRLVVDDRFGLDLPVWVLRATVSGHEPGGDGASADARWRGGLGMTQMVSWSLLLDFQDAPAGLDAHPALSPDSLAAWLGVALEWQNPEGCTVVSIPRRSAEAAGVPQIALLEEVAGRLEAGELRFDVPEAWLFNPAEPMPVLE